MMWLLLGYLIIACIVAGFVYEPPKMDARPSMAVGLMWPAFPFVLIGIFIKEWTK